MAGAEIVALPGSTMSAEAVLHQALQRTERGEIHGVCVLTFDTDSNFDVTTSTATFGDLSMMVLLFQRWVLEEIDSYDGPRGLPDGDE